VHACVIQRAPRWTTTHPAEYNVFSIEPRRWLIRCEDVELRIVGVRSLVCHANDTGLRVLQTIEGLVFEGFAVDGKSPSTVAAINVAALRRTAQRHENMDVQRMHLANAKHTHTHLAQKSWIDAMESTPSKPNACLVGAELPEILASERCVVEVEFDLDPAEISPKDTTLTQSEHSLRTSLCVHNKRATREGEYARLGTSSEFASTYSPLLRSKYTLRRSAFSRSCCANCSGV